MVDVLIEPQINGRSPDSFVASLQVLAHRMGYPLLIQIPTEQNYETIDRLLGGRYRRLPDWKPLEPSDLLKVFDGRTDAVPVPSTLPPMPGRFFVFDQPKYRAIAPRFDPYTFCIVASKHPIGAPNNQCVFIRIDAFDLYQSGTWAITTVLFWKSKLTTAGQLLNPGEGLKVQ